MEFFNVNNPDTMDDRMIDLVDKFKDKFEENATVVIRVPGRVNLIGEHIDYCGYAVHPMAIEQDILVALCINNKGGHQIVNLDSAKYPGHTEVNPSELMIPSDKPVWWAYFLCGLKGVQEELGVVNPKGLTVLVTGTIPPSAGLSSSSALVVSAAIVSVWSNELVSSVDKERLAGICARAERFIGTQGGGMDQAIELLAERGSAKLIEFNPLRTFNVSLPVGATFVVANTLEEKNKAASNDFNTRVVECRLATKVLAKKLLDGDEWKELTKLQQVQERVGVEVGQMMERAETVLHETEYTLEEITTILGVDKDWIRENVLTENTKDVTKFKLYQRSKHVYSEAARVYQLRDICNGASGDNTLAQLGDLMAASHSSCANMYQCSSPGLDKLVELSLSEGALGARLTGAGWGGCIVALIKEGTDITFIRQIKEKYYNVLGLTSQQVDAAIFVTKPGSGAQIFSV